jgi:uncharacterized protein YjgD (DUF1641 family)
MAAGDAALNALEDVDPIKLKRNVEVFSECTMKALTSDEILKAKPVGVFSLLSVLKDPDVSVGLGVLITMAKMVGRCLREKAKET